MDLYLNDPWIDDRLEWLMEHQPKQTEKLFRENPDALLRMLCQTVKASWLDQQAREARGQDSREAANATFEEIIAPSVEGNPKKQLPLELQQKMTDWLMNLSISRPQTETTESEP